MQSLHARKLLVETIIKLMRDLSKRKGFLLASLILLYPVWVYPLLRVFPVHAPLLRDIRPEMTLQEEYLTTAWNCLVDLFFLQAHPEIVEGYRECITYYRMAGRPDLSIRVRIVGSVLIGWGFSSKTYALTLFPYLLFFPYLPIHHKIKQLLKVALIILCLYVFMLFPLLELGTF